MQETLLNVQNLSVSFDRNKILDNLNFSVQKGDILAVIGPNGAGKTVLFRALLGLIPYSGKVNWRNNIKIGYVPQRFIVERDMPLSVGEFLDYKKTGENQMINTLKMVGFHVHDEHHLFHHLLNQPLGVLSGGELQKVLIAFALLVDPKVLLFDEPTTGIDLGGEETIYNLLKKLKDKHGLTIIFISHDIHIVYQYASNVLCINKEKVCFGPPHEALSAEELKKLHGADVGIYEHSSHH
ncbi:MAG: ABC transporter ATP-binding protein [Candidatus Yanofskybacteria bacterium RIFCSPHIGHO2_02_FULL_41_11]|uniref:ABC transporter ATP-binding protein n=1 Tax=Candidatus Yanofskybacteria bacterium RIFCSPHIGHO2_02_FULL_41_11 TaxID=1802675 RepID=A0A1F8F7B7_9BACT|nr:MAG: ABC transporter ATP-binding protein [Candidatus Yanofskybacteria bacterium RIFCSPHIGHO2_02_FULL_41_11]